MRAPHKQRKLTLSIFTALGLAVGSISIADENDAKHGATRSNDWVINTTGENSPHITKGGEFVEVDILSITEGEDIFSVKTNSIPGYEIEVNQSILDRFDEYVEGTFKEPHSYKLGDSIQFGEDVGFDKECENGISGWAAPGPPCLEAQQGVVFDFPLTPTVTEESCETGVGPVGLWANGVVIFNWTDTFSYNDESIWNYNAYPVRRGGMDICFGHGDPYHHHTYNECLRQEFGDEGTGHSPVYGYAGDGFPIHGPYHAENSLVKSCWIERDYSADSATGCGVDGERSCQYVDVTDISKGFKTVSAGPTTSEKVRADGGPLEAVAGFFKEDYYYDATCTEIDEAHLDHYNGHEHDDIGYHYHTSVDEEMSPTFPLAPAVNFRGQAGGSFSCSSAVGARVGPPDTSAAAARLGIDEEELTNALGRPPFDFEAVATKLGVSVEELEAAMDAPSR